MNFQKLRIIIIAVLTCSLFGLYSVHIFRNETSDKNLPVIGQVNDFQLIDEKNRPFSIKDLKGKVWTANFFFTTCSDICPIMTKNMAAIHRSFEMIDQVAHVSVTVNPETDDSGVLKKYAEKFNANTDKWHFLTGPRHIIHDLAVRSFKLGAIDEPVFHSSKFALIDRHGFIRGYYDGVQAGEVSQLYIDATRLLKEK